MQKKRITINLIASLIAEIAHRIFPFLIIRHAQSQLGLDQFGRAQFGINLVEMAMPFVLLGYPHFTAIEVGKNKNNPKKLSSFLAQITSLKLMHAVIASCVLLSFVWFIPSYKEYFTIVLATIFLLFSGAISSPYVLIGLQKIHIYSMVTISAKTIGLILIYLFVNDPTDAIIYAVLTQVSNGIISLFSFIYSYRAFPFSRPSIPLMKKYFRQSLSFAIILILMTVIDKVDLFFVRNYFSDEIVGLYAGPWRIVQSYSMILLSISTVFFAENITTQNKETTTRHLNFNIWLISAITLPIAFGSWFVNSQLLSFIIGGAFFSSGMIFSILILGASFYTLYQIFGYTILLAQKKIKHLALSLATGIILLFVFSPTFINAYGISGLAVSVTLSKAIIGFLCLYKAKPFYEKLPIKEFLSSLFPASLMALFLIYLQSKNMWVNLSAGGVVYLLLFSVINRKKIFKNLNVLKSRLL